MFPSSMLRRSPSGRACGHRRGLERSAGRRRWCSGSAATPEQAASTPRLGGLTPSPAPSPLTHPASPLPGPALPPLGASTRCFRTACEASASRGGKRLVRPSLWTKMKTPLVLTRRRVVALGASRIVTCRRKRRCVCVVVLYVSHCCKPYPTQTEVDCSVHNVEADLEGESAYNSHPIHVRNWKSYS